MKLQSIAILFALMILSSVIAAQGGDIVLSPDHPDQYVVKKGDTLWDIAEKFLRDPWRWTEIWEDNKQIENPHLIYPGDVIYLTEKDGRPVLNMRRRDPDGGTDLSANGPDGALVKVTPTIREGELSTPIPTIPMSVIRPFLSKPRVVTNDMLDDAAYIVSFQDGHLLGGTDSIVYVRNLDDASDDFDIVRKGKPYRHHRTGEILGYEALYVGKAQLLRRGDPATFKLLKSERDARIGDRLIRGGTEKGLFEIQPHVPETDIRGAIIRVVDGVTQIGQHDIVVIDLGSQEGIEPGHVLSIYQSSNIVRDTVINDAGERIRLPEEKAGFLMVFRSFRHVSYGLVMSATRALHLSDTVRTPPLY